MRRRPLPGTGWEAVPDDRTRVLLECQASATPWVIAEAIERHGYAVRTCEGPDQRHRCPLVTEGACALVGGADVVVHLMPPDPEHRPVLRAVTGQRRPPAVVALRESIEAEGDDLETSGAVPRWVTAVDGATSSTVLLGSIRRALDDHHRPPPVWGDGFC